MGLKFREEYKKIAEENTVLSQEYLSDFFDFAWKFVRFSSARVDKCLNNDKISNNKKVFILLMMLRNCISDICCCLDSLERGHERTVLNNLRMIFEDYCCIIHLHNDDSVYQKFLKGKHQASGSIGPAKKLYPDDEQFKFLYGELSKISHHVSPELIARQMQSRDGLLSHLKVINPDRLYIQTMPASVIINFLFSIAELAMEICQDISLPPDFWRDSSVSAATISNQLQELLKRGKGILEKKKIIKAI